MEKKIAPDDFAPFLRKMFLDTSANTVYGVRASSVNSISPLQNFGNNDMILKEVSKTSHIPKRWAQLNGALNK